MAWNISKEKRRALVKLQLRDKHGRFVEMGSGVKWFSSALGKEVAGEVVDGEGTKAIVRLNKASGGQLVKVPAKNITVVDAKATLPAKGDKKSVLDTPEFEKPEAVAKEAPESDSKPQKSLAEVSAQEMAEMPAGTILGHPKGSGSHFVKEDGDNWKQILSNGEASSNVSTSASIKNHDGFQDYKFSDAGTEFGPDKPEGKSYSKMSGQDKIDAAEKMYGTGSPQHKQAQEKFGGQQEETAPSSNLTVSKTSDGNTYITAPEGAELYTPAKELQVGDEVISPDGADETKPFSMGKGWAYKKAERLNPAGPQIGKVTAIKDNKYAIVQLPEGHMIPHPKTGEDQNSTTIGLSNNVIKATPELKEQLKDVLPEPVYTAPEASADAKKEKRLALLKASAPNSTVSSKSGEHVVFGKSGDNSWNKNDGTGGYTDEDVVNFITENDAAGWMIEQDTTPVLPDSPAETDSVSTEQLLSQVDPSFIDKLKNPPIQKASYAGSDPAHGKFAGFNEAEYQGIQAYVAASNSINGNLRHGKIEDEFLAEQVLGIDSIMDKSAIEQDTKVFRGVGANAEMLDAILNKGIMNNRGFTSTTNDESLAGDWVAKTGGVNTPILMEVDLPAGFKAHKIDYALVGEGFAKEQEVLLPRDLDLDITSVEEWTNKSGTKGYRIKATPILNDKNFQKNGVDNGSEGNTGDSSNGDAGTTADPSNGIGNGNDSGQSGEVRNDSGSGDIQDTGGSEGTQEAEPESQDSNGPLDPQYEALAKQIADLKAEIDAEKGASAGSKPKRDRETIMNDLAPIDVSNWKKVGSQAGSNPGGVFEDENGQKWYVKQSKSEQHARAEVLASQLYNAAGIESPAQRLTTFDGKTGTASPMIDGAKSDFGSKYSDKAYMDKVKEGFAVDAWLANWDVLGLGDDNIVTGTDGNPNRIDTGGTMMFRAQGGLKNDSQPGAWGNEVKDWDGLRSKGEAQKAFKDITDQQMVDSAARVESISPEEIDNMVDALGWTGPEADELKTTLKARREDIIAKAKALGVEPTQKEESAPEAPEAPADEPFEPVLPSAQKAAQPVYTKENPKVLSGYTISQDDRGVNYPEERLSIEDWNGLRNGTVVPASFPFIPFKTTSGEVHYWDSEGNKHWGQYGGAGALTRRKNANGEYEYLLAQRASTLSTAPDMWTTPGGAHYNLEESKAKGVTARIELEEELGLNLTSDPVAEYKHATVPDWSYDYSIFDAPEGTEISADSLDKREIQDVEWYTAEEIRGLREEGRLHPAMSEVLDNLLDASESVEGAPNAPETSNEDSNAPEAPSPAAEAPSLVEPDSTPAPETTVNTDGPSVSMADGKPAYEGSKITHAKFGTGTVLKIIAGKSAKIEFDDGTVKIAQAHKISSFDGESKLDAPADTTGMAPGDFGNNPANGKLFIVGANGQAMYQGDKVSASHKGMEQTGVIKGIYKSTNSVAIIFDGEEKPVTKKAALTSSLEKISTPEEPTPSDPNAVDEEGYTAKEREVVDALEAKVARVYKGDEEGNVEELERALDYLYAKADARLNGEPEPEDHDGVEERLQSEDPVQAIEESVAPEEAPEAPETLVEPETAPDAPEETPVPEEAPEVAPEPTPATRYQSETDLAPVGSTTTTGGGHTWTKNGDGEWEMTLWGEPTGIKATNKQIGGLVYGHGLEIKTPQNKEDEQKKSDEALAALKEKLLSTPDPVEEDNRDDVTPEEDQWVDEWETEQAAKKAATQKEFDSIVGDLLNSPTGTVLDSFPPGTQVVGSTNPKYTWTKTHSKSLYDGDPIWKDQNGYEASAFELSDGSDFKVVEYGPQDGLADWEKELLDAGGNTVDEVPEAPETTPELSKDDIQKTLSELPIGSAVGDPADVQFIKIAEDLWETNYKGTPSGVKSSDEAVATLASNIPGVYGLDTLVKPEDAPKSGKQLSPKGFEKSPYMPDEFDKKVFEEIAALPIGTKVPGGNGEYWIKKDVDVWDNGYEGDDSSKDYNYGDAAMAELYDFKPSDFDYKAVGKKETPAVEPSPGTLGGVSKEDFDKLPVGSEIKYSDHSDFNDPDGVYTKKENGNWDYTPKEADAPVKEVESDKFDHLFESATSDPSYAVVGSDSEKMAEPKVNTGVTKNVYLNNYMDKIPGLPVGTTIKPEVHESYYNKNDTYWVKEGDNLWQSYKKTTHKTMKGETRTDSQMSYVSSYGTISEPVSTENVVLGSGELAYVGDTVFLNGESYTINKINKTGIKVVSSYGEKTIVKPHGLKKDVDFGKPKKNPYGSYDPVSTGHQKAEEKKAADAAAKAEAEKLKQSLENYGGASADDYDAYGVTMPSNPTPNEDNGLSVVEAKEVDESNPLYGAPKPVQPPSADEYPAYKPIASEPLPKWDSAAWLKKVEERYKANPNKAKATVQESAKWAKIQSVLDGNKEWLNDLKSSMYLDEDMFKEAHDGIDAQEKINLPLKEKMVEEANAHKAEYDAKKAKALAEAESLMGQYKKDLESWIEANPSGDHYKKAKKPSVSKEAFTGGEADWSKAHVGTHTAKSIMESMKDDNVLGTHGLSFAADSDQIDDLDIKVTKVLDASGEEKFEFKFRLTSPHGKAFALGLKNDDKVSHTDGIYPQKMVLDKESGLMKDSGKPSSYSFVKNGKRYVYSDPMTGAEVVFQKSSYEDGINITDLDNTVKIHMPMDATPEMLQQTLENMGIKKARPSTAGDIMVLAENKLIAMMGVEMNGIKPYDQRENMTGDDRAKVLAQIKEEFGVTPADLTFSTEPNGRVKFFLSDEKAKQFAKDYNVSHFKHGVSNDSSVDTWIGMLAGTNAGLLSTYHRFTEGIGGEGMSSSEDLGVGSGDGVYVSPKPPGVSPTEYTGVVIKPSAIFKRVDFWANPSDSYGKKGDGGSGGSKLTPHQLWKKAMPYEVTPKDSIPISDWAFAVLPANVREKVIKALQEKGIFQINGLPLEEFLITSGGTAPIDLTTPGTV